uniref:Putative lipocalin n=1 Tax=Ixodes ricinus TaxID=34613 RepID=V5ICR5_IXORI
MRHLSLWGATCTYNMATTPATHQANPYGKCCSTEHLRIKIKPPIQWKEKIILTSMRCTANQVATYSRSPLLQGGCDFWLNQSLLADVLKHANNLTQSIDAEAPKVTSAEGRNGDENKANTEKKNNEEKRNEAKKYAEALFKSLPTACRYAFIASCGYPQVMMYDKAKM